MHQHLGRRRRGVGPGLQHGERLAGAARIAGLASLRDVARGERRGEARIARPRGEFAAQPALLAARGTVGGQRLDDLVVAGGFDRHRAHRSRPRHHGQQQDDDHGGMPDDDVAVAGEATPDRCRADATTPGRKGIRIRFTCSLAREQVEVVATSARLAEVGPRGGARHHRARRGGRKEKPAPAGHAGAGSGDLTPGQIAISFGSSVSVAADVGGLKLPISAASTKSSPAPVLCTSWDR